VAARSSEVHSVTCTVARRLVSQVHHTVPSGALRVRPPGGLVAAAPIVVGLQPACCACGAVVPAALLCLRRPSYMWWSILWGLRDPGVGLGGYPVYWGGRNVCSRILYALLTRARARGIEFVGKWRDELSGRAKCTKLHIPHNAMHLFGRVGRATSHSVLHQHHRVCCQIPMANIG
jgi:hypothetical protein